MAAVQSSARADGVERLEPPPGADAARELYERHGDVVFAFCLRRLRSREEAEDALQTTFLHAVRALARGVVPLTQMSWLLKIAENACNARWHDSRRRSAHEMPKDPHALGEVAAVPASSRDELLAIEAALEALTESQRRAIVLREWQGLSYREIADELGISQGAAEVLTFRARRALSDALERTTGRRRMRALDVGSLLASVKAFFGGSLAAKAAIAAVAVAAGASTVAAVAATGRERPEPALERGSGIGERPPQRERVLPKRSVSAKAYPAEAAGGARPRGAKRGDTAPAAAATGTFATRDRTPSAPSGELRSTTAGPAAATATAPATTRNATDTTTAPAPQPSATTQTDVTGAVEKTIGTVTKTVESTDVTGAVEDTVGTVTKTVESTAATAGAVVESTVGTTAATVDATTTTLAETVETTADATAETAGSTVETVTSSAGTLTSPTLP